MIHFRCWYCWRRYRVDASRVGETIACSCNNLLRVPRHDHGNCRVRSLSDWLVYAVLCGGLGALMGLGMGFMITRFWRDHAEGYQGLAFCTAAGFIVGLVRGEQIFDVFCGWLQAVVDKIKVNRD